MLTPGVEYFGASSDRVALAFGEGRRVDDVSILRADLIHPDGHVALLGSLLTGTSVAKLIGPDALRTLEVEERDEGSITIVRLPDVLTRALTGASESTRSSVAQRALGFPEFRGADPAVVSKFLADLGATATAGGGGLYARVIDPPTVAKKQPPIVGGVTRFLPYLGFVVAIGFLVLMIQASSDDNPALRTLFQWSAVVVGAASGVALVTRRRIRKAREILAQSPGSLVVMIFAGKRFRSDLSTTCAALGVDPSQSTLGKGRRGFLAVDPAGISIHVGDETPIVFPVQQITDVHTELGRTDAGAFGASIKLTGLTFQLGAGNRQNPVSCFVPVLNSDGKRLTASQSAELLHAIRSRLGIEGAGA